MDPNNQNQSFDPTSSRNPNQAQPQPVPGSTGLEQSDYVAPESEPQESALETTGRTFLAILGGFFSWIVFPVVVVLILHNFVFQAYHVLGSSMVPTLHESDYLIVSKIDNTQASLERLLGKKDPYIPARGQIIVFHYPQDVTKVFVKRVVGLPGERVTVNNGAVTVYNKENPNGFNPDKTYEPDGTQTLIDTDETVQPGNVFVMGDNRTPNGSFDSREWGQLPSSYIIGNAVLRLLPLAQSRLF